MAIIKGYDFPGLSRGDIGTLTGLKFGTAPDFDNTDGNVTIWDGANDGLTNAMTYTYSSSADIDSISSSDDGDTNDVIVVGLDTDWALTTQTVTLTGNTAATLTTPLRRAFRMYNDGSTGIAGNVYLHTNGAALTLGTPDVATTVRAVILGAANQSQMAIYTVPAGYTMYLLDVYFHLLSANKSTNYKIELAVRLFNKVFRVQGVGGIDETGTSAYNYDFIQPFAIPAKSDIECRCTALSAATGVSISAGFEYILQPN